MSISLTEKAANEVRRVWEEAKYESDTFLRIGVAGGGCSGFNYVFRPDKAFDENADNEVECHGVKVVVDKKSALFLEGLTIDWYEGLERRGFTFDNPNAVKTCGCGSSFQA